MENIWRFQQTFISWPVSRLTFTGCNYTTHQFKFQGFQDFQEQKELQEFKDLQEIQELQDLKEMQE